MDENPYASPAPDPSAFTQNRMEFSAQIERSSWAYRRLQLFGPANVIVEYNGRGFGYESVLVNGNLVTRAVSIGIDFSSPIDFELKTSSKSYPARIEIQTWMLYFVGGFRLYVDDLLVYSEGNW